MNSTRNDADQPEKASENSGTANWAVSVSVPNRWRTSSEPSSLNLRTDTRQADWRRANPEKYLAHIAVQRALKAGTLIKGPCEVCGDPAVDGHHDDYSKPLEVRWLCRQHHTRLHNGGEDMFSDASVTGQRQERA